MQGKPCQNMVERGAAFTGLHTWVVVSGPRDDEGLVRRSRHHQLQHEQEGRLAVPALSPPSVTT